MCEQEVITIVLDTAMHLAAVK